MQLLPIENHRPAWFGFFAGSVRNSDPLVLFAHILSPIDSCSSLVAMLVCAPSQELENTALTIAAYLGHAEVVRLLLQNGAKVDHQVGATDLSCIESGAS